MTEMTCGPHEIAHLCQTYASQGFRLQTMIATDERQIRGAYVLRYVFIHDATCQGVVLETTVPHDSPHYTSVTAKVPAANWYEREAQDLLGLVPDGHPEPLPLVLHGELAAASNPYPLRKDVDRAVTLPPVSRSLSIQARPQRPDGEFEVPVGPIHAGVIEPGHFRFHVRGEDVESVDVTLFYTHRGLEKCAEGLTFGEGLAVAEQACGVCSASHGAAFAQAVEAICDAQIPERAMWIRLLVLELERLYNHIGDVGNICAGIGFSFGVMQAGILKEKLQRHNALITGHRFLRNMIAIGGVARDVPSDVAVRTGHAVQETMSAFSDLVTVLLSHEIVCDRFRQTGILTADVVRQYGVIGPAARASGYLADARLTQPSGAYRDNEVQAILEVPTFPEGDVMARVSQRIEETYISAKLIGLAVAKLHSLRTTASVAALTTPMVTPAPYQWALGVTESPRGENVHFVMAGPNGTIDRLRIRSASYANWPAVAKAVPGNIIADFPLINKSFELCYACCDR